MNNKQISVFKNFWNALCDLQNFMTMKYRQVIRKNLNLQDEWSYLPIKDFYFLEKLRK